LGAIVAAILVALVLAVAPLWLALSADAEHVSLYSGGKLAREWTTSTHVTNLNGGVWMFKDSATGRWVRVSGDVVVEPAGEK
jgi:hypothetical protein